MALGYFEQDEPYDPAYPYTNNVKDRMANSLLGGGGGGQTTGVLGALGKGGVQGFGGGGGFSASSVSPLVYARLIAAGKVIENKNPNSFLGRGLLSGLGPSFNQVKADPKLAFLGPFAGLFRNQKAAEAKPEWYGLAKSIGWA